MMAGLSADKFVIVMGMPRGGTTSLYHIFDNHPGFFVPFRKETAFFSYNSYKGESWYRGLYSDCEIHQVGVDISPQYFVDLRSVPRIKAMLPHAKIILSVRNPVDWIISSFFQTNKFEKQPDFSKFLNGYTITGAKEKLHCSLADGYVSETIQLLMRTFGKDLLLYRFELFNDDPLRVLKAIEVFCGTEPYFNTNTFTNIKVNSAYQYNFRLLTWLLSREVVISTIDTFFTRSFIKRVRLLFDGITMPKTSWSAIPLSDHEIKLAEKRLSQDKDWVDKLFEDQPIRLGDGTPFME